MGVMTQLVQVEGEEIHYTAHLQFRAFEPISMSMG